MPFLFLFAVRSIFLVHAMAFLPVAGAPPYRGHGLQRLFNKIRIGQAIELGATEGLTSIAPSNPYSYNNFLIVNFEIVDRRPLYGGKDRYLLRKEFFKEPDKKPELVPAE